jgi:hypothetical protein
MNQKVNRGCNNAGGVIFFGVSSDSGGDVLFLFGGTNDGGCAILMQLDCSPGEEL